MLLCNYKLNPLRKLPELLHEFKKFIINIYTYNILKNIKKKLIITIYIIILVL